MAYTAVPTVNTGDPWSASDHNTYVKENFAYFKTLTDSLVSRLSVRQLWVSNWKPTLTNGCLSSAQLETATNKVNVDYTGFVDGATKYGYANVPMPEDYTGGTVYYKAYWKHPTATKYVVRWQLSGVAVGNNETLDVATGTAVAVDDTGGTANKLYISDLSGAVTIAGSPAAGELVHFLVSRAGAHANDTLDATARLIGVTIWYPVG